MEDYLWVIVDKSYTTNVEPLDNGYPMFHGIALDDAGWWSTWMKRRRPNRLYMMGTVNDGHRPDGSAETHRNR